MREDIRVFAAANRLPMDVQMAGISYCDGSYLIERRRSHITVIEYIVEGEGYVSLEGVDTPVTKDSIYILPAGEDQRYYSSADCPWVKIFINLTGDLPPLLTEQYGLAHRRIFDGMGLKYLFDRIARIVGGDGDDEADKAALMATYHEALVRLSMMGNDTRHSDEAARLKQYLDANITRAVGNGELAASVFRSPDYCIKLFKREYGTTPYDYQIKQKLHIAKGLLRDTSMPVAEVASAVGYADQRYFSGLFRQKCGISPTEYRRLKSH